MARQFDAFPLFDDKGEVKRLIDSLIQARDPEVTIDSMRKLDFSYIFTLSKRERCEEVELTRSEIEDSWDWRRGNGKRSKILLLNFKSPCLPYIELAIEFLRSRISRADSGSQKIHRPRPDDWTTRLSLHILRHPVLIVSDFLCLVSPSQIWGRGCL